MADAIAPDTNVVDNADLGDEIPLPDNLADTELNGLTPADDATASEQVEAGQEETEQAQPENPEKPAEGEEAEQTSEEETEENKPEHTENKAELTPEEQQRQHNAQMAARRIAARQRNDFVNNLRQQTRAYEEQTNMEDVAEQVKVLQAQQYIDTVDRNRSSIINENAQAQATIPLFNPNDAEHFNPTLYQRAINRFNDTYIITDPETNEVLGAQDRNGNNVSLFQYLQQEAADYQDLIGSSQGVAQVQAHKAEAKMRAKAVNPQGGGKQASRTGDDSEEALLARIGDVPIAG